MTRKGNLTTTQVVDLNLTLQEMIARQKADIAALQADKDKLNKTLTFAASQIDQMKKSKEIRNSTIDHLQENIATQGKVIEGLKEELASVNNQANMTEQRAARAIEKQKELQNKLDATENQIRELQERLGSYIADTITPVEAEPKRKGFFIEDTRSWQGREKVGTLDQEVTRRKEAERKLAEQAEQFNKQRQADLANLEKQSIENNRLQKEQVDGLNRIIESQKNTIADLKTKNTSMLEKFGKFANYARQLSPAMVSEYIKRNFPELFNAEG